MYELMNKQAKYHIMLSRLILLFGIAFISQNCNPNIEESPDPGILRVILQSSNEDTSLVIAGEVLTITEYYTFKIVGDSTVSDSLVIPEKDTLIIAGQILTVINDTLTVTGDSISTTLVISDVDTLNIAGNVVIVSKNNDFNVFKVSVFQGKIYHDNLYAVLFTGLSKYRTETRDYNLLEQTGGRYRPFVIFESYVPPGEYDVLEFGLTASQLTLGVFNSPIELPEGESSLIRIIKDFDVLEGGTTELRVQIRPLESIARYRDSFIFDRAIEINTINYY